MLKELHIENFGIISKAQLNFEGGVNLITGETGAGKSLLIDALRVAGGGRAISSFIKTGADKAQVTAVFDNIEQTRKILEKLEISNDDTIYIRKILSVKSTPKNFINDTPVSAAALKEIFETLVEMHGQFENQKLLNSKNQIDYLDSYACCSSELNKYIDQYKKIESVRTEIENIKKLNSLSPAEIEWKKHQIAELAKISITDEEYAELLNKLKISDKANILTQQFVNTTSILYDDKNSANAVITKCVNTLEQFEGGEKLKEISEMLNSINSIILSVNSEIKDYLESLNDYICNIDELQSKIFDIQKLLRKYKLNSLTELKKLAADLTIALDNIQNAEKKIEILKTALIKETQILSGLARKLSDKRTRAAKKLEKNVTEKIRNLEMPDAEFKISIDFAEGQFTLNGCDKISFNVKTNKGDILKPLREIASGGEISRIMLALKSINAETDNIPTIIFDEIDTGISGTAAARVAEELFNLSRARQTMCVTHQPAIAALPGIHYKISKKAASDTTLVETRQLDLISRIREIAVLMTGGKVTETSLKSAAELLDHFHK